MFQTKNLSVLGSNLLFKGIDESIITSVFNQKNFRAEKEGELIFQAGDESSHLYLILQGNVKLKYFGTKGSNSSFRRDKNEFFGEQEVVQKTARISSAIADTDCIFYLISTEELIQLIRKNRTILKNLSFTPQEEEEFEKEIPAEENSINQTSSDSPEQTEEKVIDEIIMDEDLADYSFDSPADEELHDSHDENYLSYDNNSTEEDINFDRSLISEEKQFEEKITVETLTEEFQNEMPDNKFYQIPELNFSDNAEMNEEELIPAINDFEYIPDEPEKFDFQECQSFDIPQKSYSEEPVKGIEKLSMVEGAASFINNNIVFPLSEIKRLSLLLSKCSSLPEALQVNELIKKYTDIIQSLVDNTLGFLTGKNDQTLSRQNINIVLNNILGLLSEYVGTRNVFLYRKIDTDSEVNIDEAKLYSAFFQLAKNSCDSMPEGGNIFISAVKADDKVKIEFIDEGIGIPSSLISEVFEPMITHGKQDGIGLGLSIARKIIFDHNGDISVDGEIGEGTRIVVTLPAVS